MELDDTKKYLMSVAMACINYNEYLQIDETKQIETLGFILRAYQERLNGYTSQELALLITFLIDIKEEFYLEYLELFNYAILRKIISVAPSINEQINMLKYVEEKYFEFALEKKTSVELLNLI